MINQTEVNFNAPEKDVMQEMFDRAWKGITSQGGPAIVGEYCQYRMRDRACSMGHCLTDTQLEKHGYVEGEKNPKAAHGKITEAMDASGVLGAVAGIADTELNTFSKALQQAHDDTAEMGTGEEDSDAAMLRYFRPYMVTLADEFGLSTAVMGEHLTT